LCFSEMITDASEDGDAIETSVNIHQSTRVTS